MTNRTHTQSFQSSPLSPWSLPQSISPTPAVLELFADYIMIYVKMPGESRIALESTRNELRQLGFDAELNEFGVPVLGTWLGGGLNVGDRLLWLPTSMEVLVENRFVSPLHEDAMLELKEAGRRWFAQRVMQNELSVRKNAIRLPAAEKH